MLFYIVNTLPVCLSVCLTKISLQVCAALLVAMLAAVKAAPQQPFNRFPPGSLPGQEPVYYDDSEDGDTRHATRDDALLALCLRSSSDEDELTFFQRLIRPWRWFDPIYDFFSGDSDEEEEVYDEGNFPGRFPGRQVARLDQRYAVRPQAAAYQPQQVVAKAIGADGHA